jgi:DtxR family Mn-dependent transcriptional regulator
VSGEATAAEGEYLQTLYWLHEAGLPMTGANVARAMRLAAPTVHEMIGRLQRDGYITRASDKTISFTVTGEREAAEIVSRHRLIERFLEHAMSPVLEARMRAAIGDARTCPHGHPINAGSRIPGVPLADVGAGARVKVLRFENEAEDLLHYLRATGLEPGLEAVVAESGPDEVVLAAADERISLTRSVAETVSVTADPSPPPRVALPEQLVLASQRYGR